ncbi:MAG: glycosidase [Chloroflexi bacterium]|nr:MAG: glycosidase [Chloroflexota bacterium]
MVLQRVPENPILLPNPLHPWEALNVFNAAVVHHNGLFHMLYRAQGLDYVSHIGYAVSEDGVRWSRLDRPVLSPETPWEARGVEDPRITPIGDTFYMTYTAYSPQGIRACLARSTNLITWERMGIILPDEDNKDHTLFPEKVGGRYALLHRRPPDIWLAYSDDLLHWTDHRVIMRPRPETWEHLKIGAGGPPLKTDRGWLLIYHAVDAHHVYRLGAALLALDDPSLVIARLPDPILEPTETWEIKGDVPNVVFACANLVVDGTLYVYYGGADRAIGLATCPLDALLARLEEAASSP